MAVQNGPLVALTDAKLEIASNAFDLPVAFDFESTLDMVETTNFDDSGKKTYGAGNIDATCGGTLLLDPADTTGHDVLWTNHLAKTLTAFIYYPTTNVGDPKWSFNAFITKVGIPVRQGERIEVSFELQVSGGVTKAAQT